MSRLLVHGVLSVNSSCARIRLMGVLVFALRGYISGLNLKQLIILCPFSHLVTRTDSHPPSLFCARLTLPLPQSNPFNFLPLCNHAA